MREPFSYVAPLAPPKANEGNQMEPLGEPYWLQAGATLV